MNREDFPILSKNIIYFDNGATTLKPKCVVEKLSDYYYNYSCNAHRGDYKISVKVDEEFENSRNLVKEFLNAQKSSEIIFTSGATDSLNKIIFGYFYDYLNCDDEILLTKAEHASNVLPWFELAEKKNLKINYIPLNEKFTFTIDDLKKVITPKTKVISIAHITNVIGDKRPIEEVIKYAHENNILVVIDGAQSIPHINVDVQKLDIDFLAFSAHKMCGPTGVGVLYAKEKFLNNMRPLEFGGGMNAMFTYDGIRQYSNLPYLFEAGTPNIADVIAFSETIKYLNNIGLDKISEYECNLKKYAVQKLESINDVIIYNKDIEGGILTFNVKDVFAQDLAIYLDKYNICVRAGNHCAKILKDEIGIKNTCRASFYFYNTKEEIDKLVDALKNPNLKNEII